MTLPGDQILLDQCFAFPLQNSDDQWSRCRFFREHCECLCSEDISRELNGFIGHVIDMNNECSSYVIEKHLEFVEFVINICPDARQAVDSAYSWFYNVFRGTSSEPVHRFFRRWSAADSNEQKEIDLAISGLQLDDSDSQDRMKTNNEQSSQV